MTRPEDRRGFTRAKLETEIDLAHESFGRTRVRSRDISASGIYVVNGAMPKRPQQGAVLEVWVIGEAGEEKSRAIKAEVVRLDPHGIALRFLEDPFAALE